MDTMQLVGQHVRYALRDLEKGDVQRAADELRTVQFILEQVEKAVPTPVAEAYRRGRDKAGPVGRPRSTASVEVTDAVRAMLAKAGKPLHIGELMEGLEKKGVELPGEGKAANLISYLRRMDDVVRLYRGVYGLAGADYGEVNDS